MGGTRIPEGSNEYEAYAREYRIQGTSHCAALCKVRKMPVDAQGTGFFGRLLRVGACVGHARVARLPGAAARGAARSGHDRERHGDASPISFDDPDYPVPDAGKTALVAVACPAGAQAGTAGTAAAGGGIARLYNLDTLKDSEFDLICVNGDNNLENLKAPDDTWKVRLMEEDFHRLMFDTEGA